jgi:hypothetical protein
VIAPLLQKLIAPEVRLFYSIHVPSTVEVYSFETALSLPSLSAALEALTLCVSGTVR